MLLYYNASYDMLYYSFFYYIISYNNYLEYILNIFFNILSIFLAFSVLIYSINSANFD